VNAGDVLEGFEHYEYGGADDDNRGAESSYSGGSSQNMQAHGEIDISVQFRRRPQAGPYGHDKEVHPRIYCQKAC
jgi:hypothetical protein